ncbi:MAG: uracil-xanthine permease family protein [Clostridia bacterium]
MSQQKLLIGIQERPSAGKWIILSFQHVFAMFGSTVLVPMLTGLPINTSLLCSGLGTFIYILCTKARCPIYLGSSFAYITVIISALGVSVSDPNFSSQANFAAVATGLMIAGLMYVVFAIIIWIAGTRWIDRILPPVVVGPMIMVIGLGLASSACSNAGLVAVEGQRMNWQVVAVALLTLLVTALVAVYAKGFFKIVPIMSGIFAGIAVSIIFDLIFNRGEGANQLILGNLAVVANDFKNLDIIEMPKIMLPIGNGHNPGFITGYSLDFSFALAIVPVAFVTMAEHIGDHTVLSNICGQNFLKDPGLQRTLLGDGLATFVAGMIGGPANTSYGENTGVVGMTRIGSVYVTGGAAFIAILLAFIKPFKDLIAAIPQAVMGGICIVLFGFIAANGLRVLIEAKVDFGQSRNTIIASVMLVLGLGGAAIQLTSIQSLSGMSLAALAGIILNLILPEKRANKVEEALSTVNPPTLEDSNSVETEKADLQDS